MTSNDPFYWNRVSMSKELQNINYNIYLRIHLKENWEQIF